MRLNTGITEDKVKGWVKKFFDAMGAWSYAPVQHALGVHGIPDRVACVPITVTQAMVGKTIGVFAAVECKRPGRRGEQLAGHTGTQVTQLGDIICAQGIAITCDGQDDLAVLESAFQRLRAGHGDLFQYLQERLNERVTGGDK